MYVLYVCTEYVYLYVHTYIHAYYTTLHTYIGTTLEKKYLSTSQARASDLMGTYLAHQSLGSTRNDGTLWGREQILSRRYRRHLPFTAIRYLTKVPARYCYIRRCMVGTTWGLLENKGFYLLCSLRCRIDRYWLATQNDTYPNQKYSICNMFVYHVVVAVCTTQRSRKCQSFAPWLRRIPDPVSDRTRVASLLITRHIGKSDETA